MIDSRAQQRQAFLAEHGLASAQSIMIAGDASFRKYYRITNGGGQTSILMDAPPEQEKIIPFIAIAKCLAEFGYSAPDILHMDEKHGFILLGDLGDDSFNILINRHADMERTLYENAVDLVCELQVKPFDTLLSVDKELSYSLPSYCEQTLLREAKLLTEWTVRSLEGVDAKRDQEFDALFKPLLAQVAGENSVLTLRDYHVDNLMWLPDRPGLARVGLLDFQDALVGHAAYDLVSLLQDARRDVSPDLEEAMIKRFLENRSIKNETSFRAAYATLGAQRNAKIVGIFTRLYMRDGKDAYLPLIPRVWSLLERNFWLKELAPLKAWVETYVPLAWRREIISPEQFRRQA